MGARHRGGGQGGRVPHSQKVEGDVPPRNHDFSYFFTRIYEKNLSFFKIFKIKSPKSEEKSELGVGGFDVQESVPPPSSENFVAAPLRIACNGT